MIKAIELKTEYLMGTPVIDIASPRLCWKVQGATSQTAYQIKVYVDGNEVYDTGKVGSSSMSHCYQGQLESRNQVTWKVRLWDEMKKCGDWSQLASFEMGLLSEKDWTAKWIDPEIEHEADKRQPASYLKKKFIVEQLGNAHEGQRITIYHGECLDQYGNFTRENFQAFRSVVYVKN